MVTMSVWIYVLFLGISFQLSFLVSIKLPVVKSYNLKIKNMGRYYMNCFEMVRSATKQYILNFPLCPLYVKLNMFYFEDDM